MNLDKLFESQKERATFLRTCAEFLSYISVDCAGLSPGREFFKQSADGLDVLKEKMPEHAEPIQKTLEFYTTMLEKCPGPRGSMYPPGSEMFDDLNALDELHDTLLDIAEGMDD